VGFIDHAHQAVHVGLAAQDQAGTVRLDGRQGLEEFQAVHARHAEVADDGVEGLPLGSHQGLARVGETGHGEGIAAQAAALELPLHGMEDAQFVVHHQNVAGGMIVPIFHASLLPLPALTPVSRR